MLLDLLCMSNQGGVGLRIRVFDRIMCFINCHLAAHLEAVNRRNADFDHIYKTMSFSRSSNANNAPAGISLYPLFTSLLFALHVYTSCLLTSCSWCDYMFSYHKKRKCKPSSCSSSCLVSCLPYTHRTFCRM